MAYFLILMLAFSAYLDSSSISAGAHSSSHSSNDNIKPWHLPDLPETITPTHYDLHFTPNFYGNSSYFFGTVIIRLKVLNRTNFIIVHMKDLNITSSIVTDRYGNTMKIKSTFENRTNNYFIVQTKNPLHRVTKLILSFRGILPVVQSLNFKHSGIYKIPYFDYTTGKMSWILATAFYPSFSRCVFPNFDEPRFKSRFKITIFHMKNFTALSNMPVEINETIDDNWQETTFEDTPKMSSYQIGFTVTDFKYKDAVDNSTLYRLWARADRLRKVDYALNATLIIQNILRQEFGMIRALQKIDQLAIPGRSMGTGMKNWGLDTYKESMVLINVTEDDPARFRILTIIAQAMTHNYFGNLVTCRFWSHVWLNEGLTAFYEVRTVTAVDPSFGYKEVYFGEKIEPSMILDATNASRALVPYAHSPEDNVYDSIRNMKAAAILRMVEGFVGTDAFRRGIRRYLEEYSNHSVLTENLWSAIQQEVDPSLDVERIMQTWTYSGGIPIVTVQLLPGNRINATQTQFVEDPLAFPNPKHKWYVPLTYRTKEKNFGLVWMNKSDVVLNVLLSSPDDWIEFNVDRTGYYRVNYDANLWFRIARQLNNDHKVFSELTRSMLLSDALHVAKAEQLGYQIFLSLTNYASVEKGYVPWYHICEGIDFLRKKLANTGTLSLFQKYVLKLTSKLMNELQVRDEGNCIEKQLRQKIISLSCSAGHRGCIRNTTRLFKAWIKNEPDGVPADSRREVYCLGMAHSTLESEWNTIFEGYRQATTFDEKFDWLQILSCSRNATLLERLLDFNIDSAGREEIHVLVVVGFIAINPSTTNVAWNWLKRKYAEIDRAVRIGHVGYLMTEAVRGFNTRTQLQEVSAFYDVYTDVSQYDKMTINNTINGNIRFLDKNYFPIAFWLQQNVKP